MRRSDEKTPAHGNAQGMFGKAKLFVQMSRDGDLALARNLDNLRLFGIHSASLNAKRPRLALLCEKYPDLRASRQPQTKRLTHKLPLKPSQSRKPSKKATVTTVALERLGDCPRQRTLTKRTAKCASGPPETRFEAKNGDPSGMARTLNFSPLEPLRNRSTTHSFSFLLTVHVA